MTPIPLALLALAAQAPSAFSPESLAAHAADADRSGTVTLAEWEAFADRVAPDGAAVDDDALIAALMVPVWDRDGDGSLGPTDVLTVRAALDANGDGDVSADELSGSVGPGSNEAVLAAVLARVGDADGDGALAADEWARLSAELLADPGTPASWIARGKIDRPDEAGTLTVGVLLLGIPPAVDADADGRVTRADFDAIFARRDANGDGVLDRAEWSPAPRGPGVFPGGWRVPRAEDREKPCLVPWQRDLDDALALSRATGKPLLVCVNMDGESASEALAWIHYRDPEFVALMEGFVPVLASPDRRNARDWDGRGRRIEDLRFGRLVNSEHIYIEPRLYERWFDGRQVAPRHLGVAPDGVTVLFDRYLLQSLEPIAEDLRRHGVFDGPPVEPELTDEAALLASPAAAHRSALEARFVAATPDERARLAGLALSDERDTQHPELVRLALFDPDASVRAAGVAAMARHFHRAPTALAALAARAVTVAGAGARPELLDALAGSDDPRAAAARRVGLALGKRSEVVDPVRWRAGLAWAPAGGWMPAGPELFDVLVRLDEERQARPTDRELALAFAATALEIAEGEIAAGRDPSILLDDARLAALDLLSGDPGDARASALAAWALHRQGELDAARPHAAAAVRGLVPWAGTPLAARALEVLADLRTRSLYAALGAGGDWDPAVLVDLDAARGVLVEHPYGTVEDAVAWLDALQAADAPRRAQAERALARFPDEPRLHQHVRSAVLRDEGAAGLEAVYASLDTPPELEAAFAWYDGLAQLVAAERHAQDRAPESALAAYDASARRFAASAALEPGFEGSAMHYVALARAGAARLLLDAGRVADAAAGAAEALRAAPASADSPDGLGNTPGDTARAVLRAAERADLTTEADDLRAALGELGAGAE